MVINIGALKSGRVDAVEEDIHGVVRTAIRRRDLQGHSGNGAAYPRRKNSSRRSPPRNAGADFVKTSTGFSFGGATPEDVRLIRETIGAGHGIKAAGGVRTLEDLQKMVEAGATRIGASAGVKIIEQVRSGTSSSVLARF